MEELLKNDKFIQYIVNVHLPTNDMTYQEKIQTVFSSTEDFAKAMDCFKLSSSATSQHWVLETFTKKIYIRLFWPEGAEDLFEEIQSTLINNLTTNNPLFIPGKKKHLLGGFDEIIHDFHFRVFNILFFSRHQI